MNKLKAFQTLQASGKEFYLAGLEEDIANHQRFIFLCLVRQAS